MRMTCTESSVSVGCMSGVGHTWEWQSTDTGIIVSIRDAVFCIAGEAGTATGEVRGPWQSCPLVPVVESDGWNILYKL